jgi:putative ABC transport system ATP-binding protein
MAAGVRNNSVGEMTGNSDGFAIRTERVSRQYAMGEALVHAVDDVSIAVQAGEFVALLGSSGSGKSTLLNLLAGLDRPSSGAIYAHDHNLAEMNSQELAHHRSHTVGMVFQAFNLLPRMTLEENVELPLRLAEVDRAERPALARALVNRPTILLADEPTGNLDSVTGDAIMHLLQEINRNLRMTIVMVTHDKVRAARYAHRIITMRDGKLVTAGASDEIA